MKYPVLLMESVQKIAQGFESLLKDKDKKRLAGYMQKLGFDDVAATFYDLQPESGKGVYNTSVTERLLAYITKIGVYYFSLDLALFNISF